MTNFLWRYLREGQRLDWNETRFTETFEELASELTSKSIVSHSIIPLSNLKVAIEELDFNKQVKLRPASLEELERWLNPDRTLGPISAGPPQGNSHYVDRPGVLHTRHDIEGRSPTPTLEPFPDHLPRVDVGQPIAALRLVLNAPIAVIFQEQESEGMMAINGDRMVWGRSPTSLGPVATLDEEKGAEVIRIWTLLQTSPNIDLLRLPLRWWESSLLRTGHQDRLIDAWIGLEALLNHKYEVRLAKLLGASATDAALIKTNAGISHSWRSVIVRAKDSAKVAKRM